MTPSHPYDEALERANASIDAATLEATLQTLPAVAQAAVSQDNSDNRSIATVDFIEVPSTGIRHTLQFLQNCGWHFAGSEFERRRTIFRNTPPDKELPGQYQTVSDQFEPPFSSDGIIKCIDRLPAGRSPILRRPLTAGDRPTVSVQIDDPQMTNTYYVAATIRRGDWHLASVKFESDRLLFTPASE